MTCLSTSISAQLVIGQAEAMRAQLKVSLQIGMPTNVCHNSAIDTAKNGLLNHAAKSTLSQLHSWEFQSAQLERGA